MTEIFGTTTPPPLSTSFTVSPITPLVNAPVTFTTTSSGGVSPYSISWNFGDGASGTGSSIVHTFTSAQTFTVTEKVTDSSSPPQTATSSSTLTVLGTPPPLSTGFTFLPTTLSTNSLVTFTAVTTGGTAPYTITWNFGDGSTGTGTIVSHTYTTAQSFTVAEAAKDSSSFQQTATSSQIVSVVLPLTGNFGNCSNLPQGWSCGNAVPSTSSATIVNGVLETLESNPGQGGSNSYNYATTQMGVFPWSPCQAPASGAIPSGVTSVSSHFTFLAYAPSSTPSSDRYHIYIALYYWLPNGAVSAGGPTYQCLDTQIRVENVGGTFSPVGSTATYDPGDSFGWDQVTLSDLVVGQSYTLTADVGQQCQSDLAAWGLPSSTQCQLAGIEIGTEGYQFQELDVNWDAVGLTTGAPPPSGLTTSISFTPTSAAQGQSVSFKGTASGGIVPYTYSWNFADGTTGTGSSTSHIYSVSGTQVVNLQVPDPI